MTTIPDDMVERVARAILKARYYDCEPEMYGSVERFYDEIYSEFDDLVAESEHEARAAIESIQPYILPYILGADGPFVRDSDHCAAILAAEKRGEERERERWRRRPYSILEPKGGWRSKEQFSEVERRKLLPIAETLALLDGNAFFTVGAENEWASYYLPEADAIYQANGGDNGWAGEASFAKPFAAAIRKGSE